MSGNSSIEWCDMTWNPVVGCDHVSAGCDHCYAATLHNRRHLAWKRGTYPTAPAQYHKPFWTGPEHVQIMPERLNDPLHWRNPRRVFVNSVSDLFHEAVPFAFIDRVFRIMAATPQHTYQILTKRPERMRAYLALWEPSGYRVNGNAYEAITRSTPETDGTLIGPLPNVWLGVSVENQQAADQRIPLLLQTPAAVRFLSCEPLLGPVDLFDQYFSIIDEYGEPSTSRCDPDGSPAIKWVIIGGESGKHARVMNPAWALSLIEQCREADVAVFMKQLGSELAYYLDLKDKHGGDMSQWPPDFDKFRVREFPDTPQTAMRADVAEVAP